MATYTLEPFDNTRAKEGALCVMVLSTYSSSTIDDSDTTNFKGANVCKFAQPNTFYIVIDHVSYSFDGNGNPRSLNARDCVLKIGKGDGESSESGIIPVVPSSNIETLLNNLVVTLSNINVTVTYVDEDENIGIEVGE